MTSAPDTASRGQRTRDTLLDLAEQAILTKGYAATSIEELIAAAGITKSGFFYHFSGKTDLAKALLRRDDAGTEAAFASIFAAADARHTDPLDAFAEGLDAIAAANSGIVGGALPGCLAAALSYQQAQFDDEMRDLIRVGVVMRRRVLRERLTRIAASRPGVEADINDLADMAIAVLQGGMVLDRARTSYSVVRSQMQLYIAYLRDLFGAR